MDDKLNRIENKIDVIVEDLVEVKVAQAKHTAVQERHEVNLQEHMKRSDLLEQQVKGLSEKASMVEGVLKFIGGIAVLVGIIEGVVALLEYLRHVK